MAKIKDRLIYETKKMDAVERRKSNKEQTAMAKERHAHRLSEKAKAKKAHMSELDDWKRSAERGRSGLAGRVRDRDDDDDRLRGMGGDTSKKRMNANKRYGFGGKQKGRFKQNDKSTLNDMSGFKPRGGFGGIGQKSPGGVGNNKKRGGGGGGGNKRPGKRARDASRTR
jgi:rRNA-processing protein EBP2